MAAGMTTPSYPLLNDGCIEWPLNQLCSSIFLLSLLVEIISMVNMKTVYTLKTNIYKISVFMLTIEINSTRKKRGRYIHCIYAVYIYICSAHIGLMWGKYTYHCIVVWKQKLYLASYMYANMYPPLHSCLQVQMNVTNRHKQCAIQNILWKLENLCRFRLQSARSHPSLVCWPNHPVL